jgi:hypothetical protein
MPLTHDGWIFTTTRKFAPTGRLQIGQILAKPFQPEFSLLPIGPLPIPSDILRDETEDSNTSLSSAYDLKALFKLWADLNVLPAKGGASINIERSDRLSWNFDSLKSTQITPTRQYVQDSLQHGEVARYIEAWSWPWDRRLFIVTGVTIAEGARMEKSRSRAAAIEAAGNVGISSSGSARVGGEGHLESTDTNTERLGGASDFVFAYSLNEIFYRKVTHRPFRKGEVQSLPSERNTDGDTEQVEEDILVVDEVGDEFFQEGELAGDIFEKPGI